MDVKMTSGPIAFLTGITGQTASYLCELLLAKNYHVYGLVRRTSVINTERIDHILDRITLKYGDLTDMTSLCNVLNEIKKTHPSLTRLEVYNLGAMSHVHVSFESPIATAQSTAVGTLNMLEALKTCGLLDCARFYQAGSSEMFGKVLEIPQTEKTPFYPRSPYAVAKVFSHHIAVNFREAYGAFVCNGILFNHESPRRSHNFVSRKITLGVGKIISARNANKPIPILTLGNLDACRDWSHAKDMARGMWQMLQQEKPDDYVLCSGIQHSVRAFVELCFQKRGVHLEWKGQGEQEIGFDAKTNETLVNVSREYFRPAEVEFLLGSCTKAQSILEWRPNISFEQLVTDMLDQDCPEHLH